MLNLWPKPNQVERLLATGSRHLKNGCVDAAIDCAKQGLAVDDTDFRLWWLLANAYAAGAEASSDNEPQMIEQAEAAYAKAFERKPDDLVLARTYASFLLYWARYGEAVSVVQRYSGPSPEKVRTVLKYTSNRSHSNGRSTRNHPSAGAHQGK